MTKTRRAKLLSVALGVGGALIAGYFVVRAWSRGELHDIGLRPSIFWSLPLAILSTTAAAQTWATLIGGEPRSAHCLEYLSVQTTKYLPLGGVAQGVGQVMVTSRRLPAGRAAATFAAHAIVHLVGALLVGLVAAGLSTRFEIEWRIPALIAALILTVLGPKAIVAISKMVGRTKAGERWIWSGLETPILVRALSWATMAALAAAFAFWNVYRGFAGEAPLLSVLAIFLLAWSAGYVAVPVPGGIGVREVVLLAMGLGPAGIVAAASVAHRLVSMIGDAIAGVYATWALGRTEIRPSEEIRHP